MIRLCSVAVASAPQVGAVVELPEGAAAPFDEDEVPVDDVAVVVPVDVPCFACDVAFETAALTGAGSLRTGAVAGA